MSRGYRIIIMSDNLYQWVNDMKIGSSLKDYHLKILLIFLFINLRITQKKETEKIFNHSNISLIG